MARVARTTSTLIKASLSPREHPLVASRLGGVLMHVTSLPSAHGIGDLGPAAYAYVDWVAAAGFSLWQMLPIGPVGYGESPYGSSSSFAIEPLLLSLDVLAADGLLTRAEVAPPAALAAEALMGIFCWDALTWGNRSSLNIGHSNTGNGKVNS